VTDACLATGGGRRCWESAEGRAGSPSDGGGQHIWGVEMRMGLWGFGDRARRKWCVCVCD